jgi:hypothetical protein
MPTPADTINALLPVVEGRPLAMAHARLAREIVEANGYADRVHVIGRHSTDVEAERDLGGRADVRQTRPAATLLVDVCV